MAESRAAAGYAVVAGGGLLAFGSAAPSIIALVALIGVADGPQLAAVVLGVGAAAQVAAVICYVSLAEYGLGGGRRC